MILFFIFIFLGLVFSLLYVFGREKFSPANLLLAVWLVSIGIAQLRLSPYEKPWTAGFWLILLLFFVLFYFSYRVIGKIIDRKTKGKTADGNKSQPINAKVFLVVALVLTVSSLLSNLYIYLHFGTMPIFSSLPDKMRFIINKDIFGLFEYIALLPRLYTPLLFFYVLSADKMSFKYKFFVWFNIILGFGLLLLYASRLVIILPILLSYFIYLYLRKRELNFKKIIISSLVVLMVVGSISVAIPAFRNYITYKDYYAETPDYTPFTYLADISGINMPAGLDWLVPLYLIPSFNLQTMMQATDFYGPGANSHYWGGYYVSVFNPLLKIFHLPISDVVIPWKPIFLYWWITATFLFPAWADFGYVGVILISLFWGAVLSLAYQYASKKPTYLSVMLMAYLSFVVIMSIYADYLLRPEFYMDMFFILITGLIFFKFKD
ncbi:MAG: O-antigen polymerase [Candidatus Buchananbacteria bacterium]|nr:O-antigen polymerase [Candidatus Buchananbacteria bacterium]